MVIAGTARDAGDMHSSTVNAPGDLTRDRHERLLAERLHQELTLLILIRRPEIGDRVRDAGQECEPGGQP